VRHYETDPFEVRDSGDGTATLVGVAVPYDTPLDLGGIRETFAAGSIDPDQAVGVPLLYGHNRSDPAALLGHVTRAQNQPAGLQVEAVVVDRDMAAKLRLTRPGLSVGVRFQDDEWSDDHRAVTRRSAHLAELSVTPLPAYTDAVIADVRHQEETVPETAQQEAQEVEYARRDDLDQLRTTLEQIEARAHTPEPPRHWSLSYGSLYDYQRAVYDGRDEPRDLAERAADTGLTSDNAGIVRAQWLNQVQRFLDFGRPGVTAFGTAPLPDSGMSFAWPTYSRGVHTAVQPTGQANEIQSVAVDIGASSAVNIGTYGGYMRAARQLLERSEPSFRSLWEQAVSIDYADRIDNVFVDALVSAATGSVTGFDFDSGSETGATFRAALFEASVDVQTQTGMPAEFALVASDVFKQVGGYSGLPDPGYGAGANAEGLTRASNLQVEVSGIRIIHDRNLANGTILVSNSSAAKWHEQGPNVITQEQVSLLAQDMAIYGYGVTAAYVPAGLVLVTAT